jgi:HAD superfamily hydrolase (TIGR01509 family)
MDGVITDTAGLHARSWQVAFDAFLRDLARATGEEHEPFGIDTDYPAHVDGKPRYDGARSFLESRAIVLPYGDPSDRPGTGTVCEIANLKNEVYLGLLTEGVEPYASTVDLVVALRGKGVATAVVSSSRNAAAVLASAGVRDLFAVKVDGVDSAALGLSGKPAPDIFLAACARLGATPERSAVVEDALSGVEAGRRGGFALVIGVDRAGQASALLARGADAVVSDLSEVRVDGGAVADEPARGGL